MKKLLYIIIGLIVLGMANPAFAVVSNGDIDDEDMSDISDWNDYDVGDAASTQETFDGKETIKLDSGSAGNRAWRNQDVGDFGARVVASLSLYCDEWGTRANTDRMQIGFSDGSTLCGIIFVSDGIWVHNADTWQQIDADDVLQDTWQEWTFDIDFTAKTVDIYLEGSLIYSDVDCAQATATADGETSLFQFGSTTANRIAYVDWMKVGSDFAAAAEIGQFIMIQ